VVPRLREGATDGHTLNFNIMNDGVSLTPARDGQELMRIDSTRATGGSAPIEMATYVWDAGGGAANRSWSSSVNWVGDTEPVASNHAFISGSYTAVVSAAGEVAANLFVGQTAQGTLEQSGGDLTVTNLLLASGSGGQGLYYLSGGALTVQSNASIGPVGAATLTVYGAATKVAVAQDLMIGWSNANNRAAVYHHAGTVTVANLYLARASGTEALYAMADGVLTASGEIRLSADSSGSANATGRLTVAGGRIDTPNLFVGAKGLGLMTVSGTATGQRERGQCGYRGGRPDR
jgi:hypothetical protein